MQIFRPVASFLGDKIHVITASLVYATVEGYAFLFSRKGASVIAAAEIVLLFRTAGGGRVLGVAGKAAAACVAGRFLYSLFHTVKAEATGGDSKQQDILKSIWDWKPPVGDSMSSGAWLVLRELVLTANSMAGSHYYPEVTSLMASPELQPVELATRLYYLYMEHERTPAHSSDKDWGSNAVPVPDEVLKLVRDYRHFACYAYDFTDDVALAQGLKTDGYRMITAQYNADLSSGCPAYYLALNDTTKAALLCIRGTYSPEDMLTDLLASGVQFMDSGHSAHAGMVKAAQFLAKKFGGLLHALHDAGHTVTVVGHSLGAGVASLLSLLLKDRGLKPGTLRSVAYEPPACMDLALAEACAEDGLVTSLVTRDDVVPRLAPGPFAALLKQLASFDWKAEAKRDDQGTPPVLVAMQRLSGLFGSTAPGDAPSDDGSDSDGSISSKGSLHQPGYNPYVPGRIMYFSPSSEDGGGEAVKVMVPPTSPVLRRIRITSCMLSDHFIDGKEISAVLDAS